MQQQFLRFERIADSPHELGRFFFRVHVQRTGNEFFDRESDIDREMFAPEFVFFDLFTKLPRVLLSELPDERIVRKPCRVGLVAVQYLRIIRIFFEAEL